MRVSQPRALAMMLAGIAAMTAAATPARGPAAAVETWAYRIEPGDTLIGLHQRLMRPESQWRVVQRLNRIANPRRLMPGATLLIPTALLREQALQGELLHTHGDVKLVREGQPARPAVGGEFVRAGDLITTGEQSSAAIRLADGTRLTVRPRSQLRIERHVQLGLPGLAPADTRLRLDQGATDTQVPSAAPAAGGGATRSRVEIRTPVANLGVRGTEFRTRIDGDRSLAEVLEGAVAAGARSIAAGQGAVATASGVSAPEALLPAPDLGALPQRVEQLPLQLNWPPQAGAVAWRAQVLDGPSGVLVLDGRFTEPSASWATPLPDGAYRLRLRAEAASGLEGQDTSAAFTLKARPTPPLRLRPRQDEQVPQERVTLAWTRNEAAADYRLQIADNPSFQSPRLDRALNGTELTVELPIGPHYWRLKSRRGEADEGPWSGAQRFLRVEPPPPPASPSQKPPAQDERGLVLGWASAGPQAAGYRLQVARDREFTQRVLDQTTRDTEWVLAKPAPGLYYIRVQTLAADGRAGEFGDIQQVEVQRGFAWWWLLPLLLLL